MRYHWSVRLHSDSKTLLAAVDKRLQNNCSNKKQDSNKAEGVNQLSLVRNRRPRLFYLVHKMSSLMLESGRE